jgi:hypothetical protein
MAEYGEEKKIANLAPHPHPLCFFKIERLL